MYTQQWDTTSTHMYMYIQQQWAMFVHMIIHVYHSCMYCTCSDGISPPSGYMDDRGNDGRRLRRTLPIVESQRARLTELMNNSRHVLLETYMWLLKQPSNTTTVEPLYNRHHRD